jgi:hypothetical protein
MKNGYSIYKVVNTITGAIIYVGQTRKGIDNRFQQHKSDKTSAIYNVMNDYGLENFVVAEIEKASTQLEADQKEVYWTMYYSKQYNLYNRAVGNFRNGIESIKTKNVTYTGQQYRTDCYCDPARYNYSNLDIETYKEESEKRINERNKADEKRKEIKLEEKAGRKLAKLKQNAEKLMQLEDLRAELKIKEFYAQK